MRVTNLGIVAIALSLSAATSVSAIDLKLKAAGKVYRNEDELEEDQQLEAAWMRSGSDKEDIERSRAKALLEIIDCDDLPKDEFELELGFKTGHGIDDRLFNPFFDRTITLPARVLVFDEKKSYLGDLVYGQEKPNDVEREGRSYHGAIVGTRVRIKTADKTEAKAIEGAGDNGQGIRTLGPGTYYVQAVYTKTLFLYHDDKGERGPLATGRELIRSEVLTLTLPLPKKKLRRPEVSKIVKNVRVEATLSDSVTVPGQRFSMRVTYVNLSTSPVDIFNATGNGLYGSQGIQLRLVRSNGEYIGDLLESLGGSRIGLDKSAWTRIPPQGFIQYNESACVLTWRKKGFGNSLTFPAGTYHLQLTALDTLVSPNPFRSQDKKPADALREWESLHRQSNVAAEFKLFPYTIIAHD